MSLLRLVLMLAALLTVLPAAVRAEDYPSRPITILTAFPPGGGSDATHRLLEKYARGVFAVPVILRYISGQGGEDGWSALAQSKPDGYTIGGVVLPHIVLQPLLRPKEKKGYRTEELVPLCGLIQDANIVMVRADSPWKKFEDLIAYARKHPGKIRVATVGSLSGEHFFLRQIEKETQATFSQVPYDGAGMAIPALLSGEVDAYFGSCSSFLHMENTIGLAVGSRNRYFFCPQVPTFKELGYDIVSVKVRGLALPPGVPAPIRRYLENHFAQLCANPAYQEAVRSNGFLPVYTSARDFAASIAQEKARAEALLKAADTAGARNP